VFFCAAGQRSALAAQTAQRISAFCARLQRAMGLAPVSHIADGFGAWKAAGGPVEAPAGKPKA